MNERIKELAEQSKIEFTYDPTETPMRAFVECWEDDLEKFAELIVRECVGVADDYVKDCTCDEHKDCKHPRSAIGRKIREHFGVEE